MGTPPPKSRALSVSDPHFPGPEYNHHSLWPPLSLRKRVHGIPSPFLQALDECCTPCRVLQETPDLGSCMTSFGSVFNNYLLIIHLIIYFCV